MEKIIPSIEKIDFGALYVPNEQIKFSDSISRIMDELEISQEELAIRAKVPRSSIRRIVKYNHDCNLFNGLPILWYLHKELLAKGLPSPFHFDSSDPSTKS